MSLTISRAAAGDPEALALAFEREGWNRPQEQLQRFLDEQASGQRVFLVARDQEGVVGYLTLSWTADHPSFRARGIPEIQDLNVLPSHHRRGIATRLMDAIEREAAARSGEVGLGVGLYAGYGPAQRLYVLRGYVPDGAGATWTNAPLHGGETVTVDDHLVLHLVKPLRTG